MLNLIRTDSLRNNQITTLLKTLFNKESIYFYWVPRFLISIIILLIYKKFHLPNETNLAPTNPFQITDEYTYSVNKTINPLFSIIFQFINKSNLGIYIKLILGQLISAIGALLIIDIFFKKFERTKQNKLWRKISKFIIGIHPYLALYAMRFGTENFTILGLAIFLNIIDKKNRVLTNEYINSISLYLLVFFRSQLIPLFLIDFLLKINSFKILMIKNFRKNNKKYYYLFLLILIISTLSILLKIVISNNTEYINVAKKIFINNEYLITSKDINKFFCNLINCKDLFTSLLSQTLSFICYLFISTILLTGSRGRFTDMPWTIKIFDINISSMKSIENGYHSIELIKDFNQNYFILVVVLPMILFSIFHIIGITRWFFIMKGIDQKTLYSSLSLVLLPILIFPYMRYFIPLIPFSCVGSSFIIKNLYLKLTMND